MSGNSTMAERLATLAHAQPYKTNTTDDERINAEYAIAAHRIGLQLDPEALAQILMAHLPLDEEPMSKEQKIFWLRVAEWMGPDWAQGFYHTAVFATKVAGK